ARANSPLAPLIPFPTRMRAPDASKTRVNALSSRQRRASTRLRRANDRAAALRPYRGTTIASDFREVWHSDYSQHAEFKVYSTDGVRDSITGGLQMGARISRSYWIALAGLVGKHASAASSLHPAQTRHIYK